MPVVGFTRGGGRPARSPSRVEEVFYPVAPADPTVDVDELNDLMRDANQRDGEDDHWSSVRLAAPPEHAAVRVAKLTALVTAVALLCAVIVAAAFLDRQRHSAPTHGGPQHISGVRALAGVEPGADVTAVPPTSRRPGGAASAQGASNDPVHGAQRPTFGTRSASSSQRATAGASSCALAADFYRLLAGNPSRALAMVDSRMSEGERRALQAAWRDIDHVDVRDLRKLPDGRLRAAVKVATVGGEAYRVDHLLRVDPPRITEVLLLSAQQLAADHPRVEAGAASVCGQ